MKKIVLFLICAMLAPIMPVSADTEAVIDLTFEDYVSGTFPSAFTSSGAVNAYVEEAVYGDKVLSFIKRKDYAGNIQASFTEVSGFYVASFKLKVESGSFSGGVRMVGTVQETPVNIINNEVYTGNGKRYGKIKNGEWVKFDIVFNENDLRNGRYDVYMNGQKVLEQSRYENTAFSAPSGIQIFTGITNNDVKFHVDNIRVYSGKKIRAEETFGKKEYNSRSVEFKEKEFGIGDSIVLKEDFERGSIAAVSIAFGGLGSKDVYYDEDRKTYCLRIKDDPGNYNLFINQTGSRSMQSVVYQADICTKLYTGETQLFEMKYDGDSKFAYTASIKNGSLALHDGTSVLSLQKDRWYNVAAVYNFMTKTFDFYVDGVKKAENYEFSNPDMDYPSSIRMLYWYLNDKTDFLCDNIAIYEGTEPKNVFIQTEESSSDVVMSVTDMWDKNETAVNMLTGTLAFHCTSGAVFKDGEKTYPDVAGLTHEKSYYVPLRMVAEYLGFEVGWNAQTNKISVDGTELYEGQKTINVKGKNILLSSPVLICDGVTYIPVEAIGEEVLFGVKSQAHIGGLCIIDENGYSDDEFIVMNRFMVGERPSPEKIEEDFENSGKKGVHPRIFADNARFEELKMLVNTDANMKKWYEAFEKQANDYLKKEVVQFDAGKRLDNSNTVTDRVHALALMYRMTGKKEYLNKAYDELIGIGGWPSWADSAGGDLTTGTAAYVIALGYDWLYDGLTKEQITALEEIMLSRSIAAYNAAYASQSWAKYESNWNFVCNSGAYVTAMALMDKYPKQCSGMLANALRSIEYGLETFAPDGQWFEGPGYWSYAVEHLTPILMSMDSVLGKDYRISKFAGVDQTADFIIQMLGPAGMYNYSDAVDATPTNMPGLFYMANKFNRPEWITQRIKTLNEYNQSLFLIDFVSYKPADAEAEMPADSYFRSETYGDVVVQRGSTMDNDSIYFAYRAGKAKVSHGHQDAGSFILDMNGVRWAEDLGREPYSVPGYNTGGDSRWNFYKTRSEGHNTIVINPDENFERNLYGLAQIERSDFKSAGGYSVMNLDDVYSNRANKYSRGFKIDDNRKSVVIRDEITVSGEKSIYWFMHTKADIAIEGNRAILTQDSQTLCLDYVVEGGEAEIYAAPARPFDTSPDPAGQNKNENIQKVAIKVRGNGKINITVKMYDPRDIEYISPLDTTPLAEWKAPTYEMPARPVIDGICFDGVPTENFAAQGGKTLYLYHDKKDKPTVSVLCSDSNIETEMNEASIAEGVHQVEIIAYEKGNRANYRRYTAEMRLVPYMQSTLEGYHKYEPIMINPGSPDYDLGSPPLNVNDGNFDTRYADMGTERTLDLDYGEIVEIDAVALAFYQGMTRINSFDLSVSTDGQTYTKILSDKGTGLTTEYEIRRFEPVKARYVRYTGYGNSINSWNSITEFAALKAK